MPVFAYISNLKTGEAVYLGEHRGLVRENEGLFGEEEAGEAGVEGGSQSR